MRKTIILATAVATLLVLAMATGAIAAKPACKPKDCPPPDTTTTTVPDGTTIPDDGLRTCLDVGDLWNTGEWDPIQQAYTAETLPICIDLNADVTHKELTSWKVTWSGTSARALNKGAQAILIFEEQIHANSYSSNEIALESRTTSGGDTWEAQLNLAGTEPRSLVFVAMPHSGAKWTSFTVTVAPVAP